MTNILRGIARLTSRTLRPLIAGRSLNRLFLGLWAYILYPDKKLSLQGWATFLNLRNIEIGTHCSINQGVFIQGRHKVVLGNHVTLSPYVLILDAGLEPTDVAGGAACKDHYAEEVVIEDHVWVGAGAIILAGVRIGTRSIVGAGAVVTRSIPPHSVVAGVPARVIKQTERNETV